MRYSVHIETDARAPLAQTLLDKYVLKAKASGAGVEIEGALPPQNVARFGIGRAILGAV